MRSRRRRRARDRGARRSAAGRAASLGRRGRSHREPWRAPAARRPAAGRRWAAVGGPNRVRGQQPASAPARSRTARWRCRRPRSRRPGRGGSWTAGRSDRRTAPRPATAPTAACVRSSAWENTRPASRLSCVVAARLRQRGVADVEVDVEMRVVDPHRPALSQRHERQTLAVAGHQVQPRHDLPPPARRTPEAEPLNTMQPATCMCVASRSRCRNELSRPVSRSRLGTAEILAGFAACDEAHITVPSTLPA